MPGPYLWADEHVELEGNTMNPDHADESDNDMPRAVEHALRKHNAINDELCRVVAGEVWQDMQADYDEIYGMWREEMRAARELERERDRLREAVEVLQKDVHNLTEKVIPNIRKERDNAEAELAVARRERDAADRNGTRWQTRAINAEIRIHELEIERDRLREALLNVARMAEALKRPCSMDNPESAQAIRNSQYMSISYAAHDALEGKPNA